MDTKYKRLCQIQALAFLALIISIPCLFICAILFGNSPKYSIGYMICLFFATISVLSIIVSLILKPIVSSYENNMLKSVQDKYFKDYNNKFEYTNTINKCTDIGKKFSIAEVRWCINTSDMTLAFIKMGSRKPKIYHTPKGPRSKYEYENYVIIILKNFTSESLNDTDLKIKEALCTDKDLIVLADESALNFDNLDNSIRHLIEVKNKLMES